MIRRLLEEKAWARIVVVTSRYHVARARLLIKRCVRQEVLTRIHRSGSLVSGFGVRGGLLGSWCRAVGGRDTVGPC
jgi:uncharacterized SAM-binding protein YcdF (DUF218 family)